MDEEDLAELAESRKLVDTHEEMDFGGTESELRKRAGVDPENEYVLCTSDPDSNTEFMITFRIHESAQLQQRSKHLLPHHPQTLSVRGY